jgi:hypothetical protein
MIGRVLAPRPQAAFAWRADGVPIGLGYAFETMLWRFTVKAQ